MVERNVKKEPLQLNNRIIAFIGPEGSGKSTIAERVSAQSGLPLVSTSKELHRLADEDTTHIGDACRTMFAQHTYLDGETLLQIMINRYAQDDTSRGFILDGALRTLEEVKAFQETLAKAGRQLPLTVVYLQVPEEVSIARLVTGPSARKREDDTVDGVRSRLAKFNHKLEERLEHIQRPPNWEIVEIDATRSLEEVYDAVTNSLTGENLNQMA